MNSKKYISEHIQELTGNKFPIYRIYEAFEGTTFPPEVEKTLVKRLPDVCELIIREQLNISQRIISALTELIKKNASTADLLTETLYTSLEATHPSRKGMHLLLESYAKWIDKTEESTRHAFCSLLPKLGPCLEEMETSDLEDIISRANSLADTAKSDKLFALISLYGDTTGDITLGMAFICHRVIEDDWPDFADDLVTWLPPEKMWEDKNAYKLVPALSVLSEMLAGKDHVLWKSTMELVGTVLERNIGSGLFIVNALPRVFRSKKTEQARDYVRDCNTVITSTGVRAVGFCCKHLPKMYEQTGYEKTRHFIQLAADISRSYGKTAGQFFLEKRTKSARRFGV